MRGNLDMPVLGGVLLLLIDAFCVSRGRLPTRSYIYPIELATHPKLFWAYAGSLAVIGVSAIAWGLWRRFRG